MGLIRNARILMYFSPLMDKLGKQIQMTKNVHGVIQTLLTIGQIVNGASNFVPDKYKVYVAAAFSAVQGVIAVLNHFDPSVSTPVTPVSGAE